MPQPLARPRRHRVALALLLLAALAPSAARAAPHGVRLTHAGDPTTSVAVSWNSDQGADTLVQYGTAPGSLTLTAVATGVESQPDELGFAFSANLTGLTPGTTYYYRVGRMGGPFYPESDPFHFRTLPEDACDPFRIVVIGDNRADVDIGGGTNPVWNGVLSEAMAYEPDLFINTGDMVKNGEDTAQWADFIDDSEFGFALTPSLVVMGNHDRGAVFGDDALYNQLFALPRNPASDTEDYFAIDVGPIHVATLNTEIDHTTIEWTEMLAWLDADLAATDRPWKVVAFHRAMYTRGNHHTGEDDDGALNAAIVPILDAHDVDLVFSGHSHDYERYAPSTGVDVAFGGAGRSFPAGAGDAVPAPVPDGTVGTTYIVTGGAGALTTDILGFTCLDAACTYCTGYNFRCEDEVYDNDVAGTVMYEGRHNFVVMDVAAETLTFQVWATDSGNTGGAELVDSFSMVKASFDLTCAKPDTPDGGLPSPDAAGPRVDALAPAADAAAAAPDAHPAADGDSGDCGCRAGRGAAPGALAGLLACAALLLVARRRRG